MIKNNAGRCQIFSFFRLVHSIQGKGSIWKRRGGSPALGTKPEEARAFLKLVLEKAGLPPLKILLKLLKVVKETLAIPSFALVIG